jgi:hypothetical protein
MSLGGKLVEAGVLVSLLTDIWQIDARWATRQVVARSAARGLVSQRGGWEVQRRAGVGLSVR